MQGIEKKNLVAIINRLDIGGTAMNTIPLMDGMQNYFNVTVLYGDTDTNAAAISFYQVHYPTVQLIPVKYLGKQINFFKDFLAFLNVRKALKKAKPFIVHTHGSKAGLVGRVSAFLLRVPIKVHTYHGHFFHSYFGKMKTALIIFIEQLLAKITTQIIVLSKSQQHDICSIYKITAFEKTSVVALGIQQENFWKDTFASRSFFRQKFMLPTDAVAIGIVGRLAPVKNHKLFIDAAIELLRNKIEKLFFFIVGDGDESAYIKHYLQNQTKQNPSWLSHFIFTSWYTEIAEVHNGLDILVLTSFNEGTPLSVIEAQTCGKPVVSTNAGGARDTLIDEKTGFIVPRNDMGLLVAKMQELINNKDLRESFGYAAKEFAAKNFSLQTQITNTKKVYDIHLN